MNLCRRQALACHPQGSLNCADRRRFVLTCAQNACHLRVGRGEREGILRSWVGLVEIQAVGFNHVAVLAVVGQDDFCCRPVRVLPDALPLD